jgi:hypothetical protein
MIQVSGGIFGDDSMLSPKIGGKEARCKVVPCNHVP